MLDFLLVIPTLNEEHYIGGLVKASDKLLSTMFRSYRIVVVDESSNDNTVSIVKHLMKSRKTIGVISGRAPGNRGFDVRYAMKKYDSKMYFYMDADLEPSLPCLEEMVKYCRKGYDVVIGSRYIDEKLVKRPPLRKAVSKAYNRIINLLFGMDITDYQCGFKLFDNKAFKLIGRLSEERHWMWDVEALLIAHAFRLKIKEVPINYLERRSKRTPLKRLARDMCIHTPGIARLFYRFELSNPKTASSSR